MKMSVMIVLNLVLDHISNDAGETLGLNHLLKMMGKLVSSCRLEDSGYAVRHMRACWYSLVVCAG